MYSGNCGLVSWLHARPRKISAQVKWSMDFRELAMHMC